MPGTGPDDDEAEEAGVDAAGIADETAEDAKARYARALAAAQRRRDKAAAELERRQVERMVRRWRARSRLTRLPPRSCGWATPPTR